MAITMSRFAGASVIGFRSTMGWDSVASTVTVNLVEDKGAGDRFTNPDVGTPLLFTAGAFRFEGIVQRVLDQSSEGGRPTYEIILEDPRSFLDGAKVVIDSYTGAVNGVPNILNAYGYFEDRLGFGGSLTNQGGMLWAAPFTALGLDPSAPGGIDINVIDLVGIMPALTALTSGPSNYGGPLQYKGHYYSLDLSGLPLPPSFYRIGGSSAISVLDCINQLCQDSGCSFICYLENGVIKFKTVSRQVQQPRGILANFVNGLDNVISKDIGVEFRNDPTNAVLLGGNVQYLIAEENPLGTDAIWPFWGLDPAGNPIIGTGTPEGDHEAVLNAEEISDIMGSYDYPINIPELRCAAAGFDSWAAYVLRHDPVKAELINLVSGVDWESDMTDLFPDVAFSRDVVADGELAVKMFGEMNETEKNYWMERAMRVYNFVANYAENYFGRKFLVRIPFFIYWKYENETTHLVASDEPCDSGFAVEGGMLLGLDYGNENIFMDEDGKLCCYVRFNDVDNIDLQNLPLGEAVAQRNGVFVLARQDQAYGVLYGSNSIYPYIVIDVPPVYGKVTDPLGGINDIAAVMGLTPEAAVVMFEERQGSCPMRIAPPPYRPDAVAIPIKSNRMSYGPWGTFYPWGTPGVAGAVTWERQEELVPWNYGGYDSMNQAAVAQLANAATNVQEMETATVELAEMPRANLGDVLVTGGPNITDISISLSAQGYTTSYTMQTFTPRRLGYQRSVVERIQRLGRQAHQMRLAVRQLFQRRQQAAQRLSATRLGFMQNASRAILQQSPHEILTACMTKSTSMDRYRTRCSLGDPREAVANVRADKPEIYWRSAAMSLEGLLRPFSTALTTENAGPLPHFETPAGFITSSMQSATTLNPFKSGCDIDWLASGLQGEYPGTMHRLKTTQGEIDYGNARPLGLRLPLVGVGWGYEITGKPVPNSGNETGALQTWSSTFLDGYLDKPEKWRAGPILLNWDNWRKGWTVPTVLHGTLDSSVSSGGSALMTIRANGSAIGDKVTVFEVMGTSTPLPSGSKVVAMFYPLENRWIIVNSSCS